MNFGRMVSLAIAIVAVLAVFIEIPIITVPITLTPFGARPLSRTRFVLTAG
jgi:hypothetical protein